MMVILQKKFHRLDFADKKRPSTFRIVRPVNGLIFGIRFLCSVRQT